MTASDDTTVFRLPAAGALYTLVAHHVVQGRVIFPGAGYLEMARAAASAWSVLSDVFFVSPLATEVAGLQVECAVSSDGRFEVRSSEGNSALAQAAVHCSAA